MKHICFEHINKNKHYFIINYKHYCKQIEAGARRCVDILVGLVQGKADYALEESIVVMTDILRKYPSVFESVIVAIADNNTDIKIGLDDDDSG